MPIEFSERVDIITLRDKNYKYYNEQNAKYYQDLTLERALKEIGV